MKIAKTRADYIFFIYVPFALIGGLLSYFFLAAIILTLKWFMPAMLLLALLTTITPFATQKPLTHSKIIATKPDNWLIKLILLQLSVILLFTGTAQALIQFISVNSNYDPTLLTQQTLQFYQGGLWPWPFILLVSAAIAYLGKTKNKPVPLRIAVRPVIKKYADNIIGVGIEIFLRQGLLFSTLVTIGIITLQIANIFCQLLHLPSLFIFTLPIFIIGILVLTLLAKNKFSQYVTRKLWRQAYAEPRIILIFCITAIALLILSNLTLELIRIYFFHSNAPALLTSINRKVQLNQWFLLSLIWWFGITPLLTKTIASISCERSLREIICAGLILPVSLALLWHMSNRYLSNTFLAHFSAFLGSWPLELLLGVTSLLLTAIFFRNPNTCESTSTLKMCPPSTRSTVSFLRTLWQLCTYILAAFFLTNISFIVLTGSAIAAPIFATLFSSLLGCLITAARKSKNPP